MHLGSLSGGTRGALSILRPEQLQQELHALPEVALAGHVHTAHTSLRAAQKVLSSWL